jgi:glycosyltransferase involved in cell wall biosynthesis
MINKKPIVSICIITFKQEKYIKKCIEGALMQKTNFNFEIVIGDDSSPDLTTKICEEYFMKYPQLINFETNMVNLGMIGNWVKTIGRCKGKYIAICEGDDYWTDPLKLQKQVDFLEANTDYGICFHNIKLFNQETKEFSEDTITRNVDETTDVSELTKGNYIHTPSVMFRNDFTIPDWFKESPIGDWTLYMLAIKDRKIKKMDEVMAVYRKHNEGIWSKKSKKHRILNTLKSFSLIYENLLLPKEVKPILNEKIKYFTNVLNQLSK